MTFTKLFHLALTVKLLQLIGEVMAINYGMATGVFGPSISVQDLCLQVALTWRYNLNENLACSNLWNLKAKIPIGTRVAKIW